MDEFPMTSPNYESLERHQQLEHQHPPGGGVPIYPGTPVSSPYHSYQKFYFDEIVDINTTNTLTL